MEKILQKAWENYTSNIAVFVGAYALSILIPLAITAIFGVLVFFPHISALLNFGTAGIETLVETNLQGYLFIPLLLLIICVTIVFPPFSFGFTYVVASGRKRRRKPKISTLFEGARIFWKRAIVKEILHSLILFSVSVPFIAAGYSSLPAVLEKMHPESYVAFAEAFTGAPGLVVLYILWVLVLFVVSFFFAYWEPSIVIYNKGVVDGLKISIRKVRKNILETFVVYLLAIMTGAVVWALERAVPFIPTLILFPLVTCLLVEACAQLKER